MNPEIQKCFQEYIQKMQAKGITPTSQQINEHLAVFIQDLNNRPSEDCEGYSPMEMSKILDSIFDSDSPVQFNMLTSKEYNQMPLFRQVKHLLQTVVEKEVKLTTAGYLPPRIVKELYPLGIGEFLIDKGLYNLNRERDSISVILARKMCEMAGLTKVRKGILSATASGKKFVNDDPKLFRELFETFCLKFNWAYFDGFKSKHIGQLGFGFSLILLKKYGDVQREDNFYSKKYFTALPALIEGEATAYSTIEEYCSRCYSIRTFDRFLLHFSLVEISQERKHNAPKHITKTALFDKLVEVLPHRKFQMNNEK